MIAKMGLCVLDEGAVIRYVLAELLASNVRGAMRKDAGSSPKSMASQARRNPGNCAEVSGKVTLVRETRLKRNLRKGQVSVSYQLLSMLDPSMHYIVVRRYPERLAERMGKMMHRQLCNSGEYF